MSVIRQLSLLGVEAADPVPEDLEGLLAGPGQIVRMGGTARVSVVVDAPWRVHALVDELAVRGLSATWVSTVDHHFGVRSAYSTSLATMATAWLRTAAKVPPPGFALDGRRLRLWVIAAGAPAGRLPDQAGAPAGRLTGPTSGYTLRLGASDESAWAPVGAALAAIGLTGALLSPGGGGPAYRIGGRRRLARLAEFVGDPPPLAPPGTWPGE